MMMCVVALGKKRKGSEWDWRDRGVGTDDKYATKYSSFFFAWFTDPKIVWTTDFMWTEMGRQGAVRERKEREAETDSERQRDREVSFLFLNGKVN